MRRIAILCDFDGTVAVDDVGNRLFGTFTDRALTEPLLDEWKRGLISSRECLEREAALAHATRDDIDRFVSRCKLDPYFKDFVDFTKRRDMEVVIISDGLDYYIEKMLMRSGLAELNYYANHLEFVGRKLRVEFPYYDQRDCTDCGNCKTYHLAKYKRQGYYVVYVGNGLSDRCPSQYSDLVFAKGELLDFCRLNSVKCIEFGNFRDVERELLQRFVLNGKLHVGEETREL